MISDICRTCKNFNNNCKGKLLYQCSDYSSNIKSIKDLTDNELNNFYKKGILENTLNIAELQYFYKVILL